MLYVIFRATTTHVTPHPPATPQATPPVVITKYNGENENDAEVFIMEPDNREVDSDNDDEHFSSIESLNTY